LDVTDGVFSTHPTWCNPKDLSAFKTNLNVEVHLMVSNPAAVIDDWLVPPVKRVIVHAEALSNFVLLIEKCRDEGVEVGIAIRPETPWELLRPFFARSDILQVLTVHPGPSDQEVDWPQMLEKIRHIHEVCPQCIIEVDGGINPESANKAVEAGASLLVSGAYIFNSDNIKEAIKKLHVSS
jgi:ribulose-phosphate 3-epimerase